MLQLGDKKISEIYLGEKKVSEVYLGEKKIRPVGWFAPTANTLAYYPLSSDSKDYSRNNKHGVISGAVSFNGGAVFNWGYIDTKIAFPNGSFALSLWARTTREYKYSNGTWATLVGKYWGGGGLSNEAFILWISCRWRDNQLAGVWVRDLNGLESWDDLEATRMNIGEWHHSLVSYDMYSKDLVFATDGTIKHTVKKNFGTWGGNSFYIWAIHNFSWPAGYFYGSIQEVIFENKSRSAKEVSDYYNATKWQFWL